MSASWTRGYDKIEIDWSQSTDAWSKTATTVGESWSSKPWGEHRTR